MNKLNKQRSLSKQWWYEGYRFNTFKKQEAQGVTIPLIISLNDVYSDFTLRLICKL